VQVSSCCIGGYHPCSGFGTGSALGDPQGIQVPEGTGQVKDLRQACADMILAFLQLSSAQTTLWHGVVEIIGVFHLKW
jgi:hypothetical protein